MNYRYITSQTIEIVVNKINCASLHISEIIMDVGLLLIVTRNPNGYVSFELLIFISSAFYINIDGITSI
jgi:hypothetical protein